MKKIKTATYLAIAISISGCSTPVNDLGSMFDNGSGVGELLNYTMIIPNWRINNALSKGFPISKKTGFGTMQLKNARLGASSKSDEIIVDVGSRMMMFNTAKGIDANVKVGSGLRYDPVSRQIYLKNIRPVDVQLANTSLARYIPQEIIDAAGSIVSERLGEIPVYKMQDNIAAKFIKNIKVQNGNIAVQYGL